MLRVVIVVFALFILYGDRTRHCVHVSVYLEQQAVFSHAEGQQKRLCAL